MRLCLRCRNRPVTGYGLRCDPCKSKFSFRLRLRSDTRVGFPPEVHEQGKAIAAKAGISFTEFVAGLVAREITIREANG